jgi:hypothetical protein
MLDRNQEGIAKLLEYFNLNPNRPELSKITDVFYLAKIAEMDFTGYRCIFHNNEKTGRIGFKSRRDEPKDPRPTSFYNEDLLAIREEFRDNPFFTKRMSFDDKTKEKLSRLKSLIDQEQNLEILTSTHFLGKCDGPNPHKILETLQSCKRPYTLEDIKNAQTRLKEYERLNN